MARQSGWIFCLLLVSGFCKSEERPLPYISPGLRIGYEFGRGFTFGGKLSLGISTDPEYYNVTVGFRGTTSRKPEHSSDDYYFIQVQAGYPKAESWEGPFLGSAGVGIALFGDRGAKRIRPIFNFCYGALLYLDTDIIVLGGSKIRLDFGTLASVPIPLRRVNIFDT